MEAETILNSTLDGSLFSNASFKFVSHLLNFPSRMLSRMRRLEDLLNPAGTDPTIYASTTAEHAHRSMSAIDSGFGPMPSPSGFLSSGYFVGVFIMALLLNRIHHIVVPPRHPSNLHRVRRGTDFRSPFRLLRQRLFPIDLSSTWSRLLFRIPSMFLLGQSTLIWSILLLHATGLYPATSWLNGPGDWAARKPMEDICWFTFTSVCITLAVGSLTRGLEGTSGNQTPFNLFAFAFHLYIYSLPLTHLKTPEATMSRPEKHVIATILIPLLQLNMTHFLEIKKSWASQRLVPTTVCGMLALTHFHSVVWKYPTAYPLTNYVPCVFESILLALILVTIALNALTQLLLQNEITRPMFGHTTTLMPKWDEDFHVVLFRLGAASLEATSVDGLSNEVGSIAVSRPRPELDALGGMVEIDRTGYVTVSPPLQGPDGRPARTKRGLASEVRKVKARTSGSSGSLLWLSSVIDVGWHRGLGKFVSAVFKFVRGIWRLVWAAARGRRLFGSIREPEPVDRIPAAVEAEDEEDADSDVYERFLRGETLSDDGDEEFDPQREAARIVGSQSDTPLNGSSDDEASEEDPNETVQLFSALSTDASELNSTSVLLAHMTDTSSSPLTRRRYSSLVHANHTNQREAAEGNASEDWDSFAVQQRQAKLSSRSWDRDALSEARRNCVICTVEPRDIICWPCRCLALCNDCRENLASRSSAAKHTCPCCRRSVEGYSKIYIP